MDFPNSQDGNHSSKPDKNFSLWYMGWSSLDRRTTLPMLPWLVAEIRRKSERKELGPAQAREVDLLITPPIIRCVPANNNNSSIFIFEHKAQCISRFIHNSHDLKYFAYLIRSQPEDLESEMACHVFKACEPNQVSEVINTIRQMSKAALKEDTKPKPEAEESFYNSQKFEVLYCGKVTVAHKKVPSTLIDDCIEKFRQHEAERKRLRPTNGQRCYTDTPLGLLEDEGDPLMSPTGDEKVDLESFKEEEGSEGVNDLGRPGRAGMPECILEDSGFGEQEVRTRCNSLVAGLQHRPREVGGKASARRRHASAPSHVQPSNAETNRTMLFQVGRFEVNLISPDSKTVVLEKNFKDISSCSQGIKQTDHFGFICRDPDESGLSQYVVYVFQCASESLVDEVMLTLKQAFSTAAALQSTKTQVQLCEACPMHDLHKLCERIEGLYPPRAKLAIQTYVSQLKDNEQADIFERVQKMKPSNDQEENELVILQLRQLCEAKQKTHLHIGQVPQTVPNNMVPDNSATGGRFKLDILKNKARTSLTSSLENIFSRGASRMRGRLGSMGSFERDETPGDSPPGTPPGSSPCFPEDDPAAPQFRRRAHTFSHPPVKKRISFSEPQAPVSKAPLLRQQSVAPELLQSSPVSVARKRSVSESESFSLPSSFSAPNFLKNFYQGSLGSPTDGGPFKSNDDSRKGASSGCSSDSLSSLAPLGTPRRVSWRQKIFLRVASPMSKAAGSMQHPDGLDGSELLPLSPRTSTHDREPLASLLPCGPSGPGEGCQRTSADYRALWKKAIHQQILLLRMEKENQRLEASRDELHIRKMKLDYQEVGQCSKEVQAVWEKRLSMPGRSRIQWDKEEMHNTLCQGVPKSRRGEVWHLLSQQHRLRHRLPCRQQPPDISYQDLLKQLTAQQHAILVDLGRTFPTHPYFSAQLGAGQLSLYNLLKAYSLLDTEVGYCQGISFVAGLLLLHMSEEQAFDMLKFLMYDVGFRRQYRPDMISLQIQMYQLSRLLHDYHRELYSHLEEHEICPSLYAAPWFLTLFASQFPLGFVARVFDFLFIQGTEVIFKVALCLLSSHEGEIMECDSFEAIVDYLKSTIPNLTQDQMEQTMKQVLEMDISKQLHAYEVEYHVLQDEMLDSTTLPDDMDRLDKLEKTNSQLKKQNMDLLEKLQAARVKIQSLEVNVENFMLRESKMKHLIRSLEQEKASYQRTIERMSGTLPLDVLSDVELIQIKPGSNGKTKKP
ncbi:TBC1 domain family member 4 isoform X2 [Brienomyrus brachyistius]|uniref:TBC1 domain family member 4 isoform X2 n=1 Tax=Brienomyrus brachyistius TaxID=42636 RepID=UPI0020B2F2D5|nr:TBC1 domain family member 4 isoform X2 [Brienomyrus brachyistius]